MSLTKVSYSMIQGATANVLDFGADPTGVASSASAFNAAVTSLTNGGIVYIPAGTFLIDAAIVLNSNITVQGVGTASIILSKFEGATNTNTLGLFTANGKSNVGLADFKVEIFLNYEIRSKFINCRYVTVSNVFFDGEWQNASDISSFPCWIAGSADVVIENCVFKDVIDAVYICRTAWDTGPDSYRITIRNSQFFQENHGASSTYPTGVYAYYSKTTTIENCEFRNIKPAQTGAGEIGYGVYEGDGAADLFTVTNCTFINDDGVSLSYPMTAAFSTQAEYFYVVGCVFNGPFLIGVNGGNEHVQVSDCAFADCYSGVQTYEASGITPLLNSVSNSSFYNIVENPIIFGNGSLYNVYSLAEGNYFFSSGYGAIYFRFTEYGEARDNIIVNCNTLNSTDPTKHAGIIYFGSTAGLCDGNSVRNLDVSGQAKYGVSVGSATNTVVVTPSNSFINMRTGSVYNVLVAPPTTGSWAKGSTIHNWDPASGEYIGWVCTVSGTPGTWNGFGLIA